MTIERIDPTDWPATISVGPGYYGLRIDTDHGTTEVRLVEPPDARLSRAESDRRKVDVDSDPTDCPRATAIRRAHAGARCEEAA